MKLPEKILQKDVEAYSSDVLRFIYYSQGVIDGGDEPNISPGRMVASTSEPTMASMDHGRHITRQRQALHQEKQHTSSQVNQSANRDDTERANIEDDALGSLSIAELVKRILTSQMGSTGQGELQMSKPINLLEGTPNSGVYLAAQKRKTATASSKQPAGTENSKKRR